MKATVYVHDSNMEIFNKTLAEINGKFEKKSLPLVNATIIPMKKEYEFYDGSIGTYILNKIDLESEFNQRNIKGVDVEFEGVVGLVDKNENSKVYALRNPNVIQYLAECECGECHKRIKRGKYIVFSKGEVKGKDDLVVLGTTCAKNYFPFDIEGYFKNLDNAFGVMKEFDEFDGSRKSNHVMTRDLYVAVCAVTDNLRVYEKEGKTRDVALAWLSGLVKRSEYPVPKNMIPFDTISEWIDEFFNKDDLTSALDMNIRSVFYRTNDDGTKEFREDVPNKYAGIAVYGFYSAKKKHDKKSMEEKKFSENKNEYWGDVGDKFEKELLLADTFGFDSAYGYCHVLTFRDTENHVFKWLTSNPTYHAWCKTNGKEGDCDYEVGKTYTLKGIIKKHEEYKGLKQTVITRCKVTKDEFESHVFSKKDVKIGA